jgi:hypothetical protein
MGGMCISIDFLMMILIEPYHCNLISAMQLAYILSITATFRVYAGKTFAKETKKFKI